MSQASNMSMASVSYCGSEMPLGEALDECFTELRGTLNSLHCYTREIGMMAEQDNDYLTGLKKSIQISDGVDEIMVLFTELKSVVKQVIGKPSDDEEKTEAKKILDQHKLNKKLAKDNAKAEKDNAKLTASMLATSLK